MRLFPTYGLAAVAASMVALTACTGTDDTEDTVQGTDEGTEGTESDAFETGIDVFGIDGEATITFSGDEATGYSGSTRIFDEVGSDGPLGTAGDVLCEYVYPVTGQPFALTQDGLDSDNNETTVTCEGCDFAFELSHDAPTVAGEGPYCEYWYAETDWASAFPVLDYVVAYHPSFDLPETDDVETGPAVLQFYDGSGDSTQYDDDGNEVEIEAQWFAAGPASLENGTMEWTNIISYYQVFEIGYYE